MDETGDNLARPTVAICIPVYNDWESVSILLQKLDHEARQWPFTADVLLVDDGSQMAPPESFGPRPACLGAVEILRLRRNLGHQRAISIGLAFIQERRRRTAVIVMDGDGQDRPKDIIRLAQRFDAEGRKRVVFARRARRTEGIIFRLGYLIFKALHRILTGRRVEVGNFSIISAEHVDRLVGVSELWNHFAAAVYKAQIPVDMISTTRGNRLAGASKMNFTSLVIHGLAAISVFADTVGARLLTATCILLGVSVGLVLCAGLMPPNVLLVPRWGSLVLGLLLAVLFQALALALVFLLIALHGRSGFTFLPLRDYGFFILAVEKARFDD